MKNTRLHFILGLLVVVSTLFAASCSGQKRFYVSAQGDDANIGKVEKKPFKTLEKAVSAASAVKGKCSIIVIGPLNAASEGAREKAVFVIGQTGEAVITITGKAEAQEAERAILSGADQTLPVLRIEGAIRLENIEITGDSTGVTVTGGGALTLGTGVKIANNPNTGIIVEEKSTLIMEGGEISGNQKRGVYIAKDCTFTMKDGEISNNKSSGWGGGVYIEGTFVMEGGQINNNLTEDAGRGGGVCIDEEASFTLKGGKITNNTTTEYSRRGGGVGNAGGGGVVVSGDDNGKTEFIMEGGEISGNTAERYGGGILFITNEGEKGTFTMTGGTITGNTARGGGGYQNYGDRFTITITGGEISGNTPDDTDNGWNW